MAGGLKFKASLAFGLSSCLVARSLAFAPVAQVPTATTSSSSSPSSFAFTISSAHSSSSALFSATEAASPTSTETVEEITYPKGATNQWEVHKFGGASLATAELYKTVGDLLIKESAGRGDSGYVPTMAVVSARGGMTDLLVKVVDSALSDFDQATQDLENAIEGQVALLKELAPPEITDPIEVRIRQDAKDILSVVQSLKMIQTVPAVTMEVRMSNCRISIYSRKLLKKLTFISKHVSTIYRSSLDTEKSGQPRLSLRIFKRKEFPATGWMPEISSSSSRIRLDWEKREKPRQVESFLYGVRLPLACRIGGILLVKTKASGIWIIPNRRLSS